MKGDAEGRADARSFLGAITARRGRALAILGAAAVFALIFGIAGTPWPCPILRLTGLPCPGCGMTRGVRALLLGRPAEAFAHHAFAPLPLLLGLILAPAALLPPGPRERWARIWARLDAGGRLTMSVLAAMITYWLLRLAQEHA